MSYAIKYLLAIQPESTVLELFRIIGTAYGIIISICIIFLKYKETVNENIEVIVETSLFSFTEKRFVILFLTMFAGTFSGLLILGNAKPMAVSMGYSEEIATRGITLLAIGNMTGRIFWGWLMDKISIDRTLLIAYLVLFISIAFIHFMGPAEWVFNLVFILIGLGFSSNFVLFAGKTAQLYSINKLGIVYPYIFLAYGIAGIIGPFVGGWLFDINQSYTAALIISAIMTLAGLILYQVSLKRINR